MYQQFFFHIFVTRSKETTYIQRKNVQENSRDLSISKAAFVNVIQNVFPHYINLLCSIVVVKKIKVDSFIT